VSDWFNDAQGIAAVASTLTLGGIFWQLRQSSRANRIAASGVLTEAEAQVMDSYTAITRTLYELGRATALRQNDESDSQRVEVERRCSTEHQIARERFLNALDRLCHNVLVGVFDEKRLRPEYQPFVSRIVGLLPELWQDVNVPQKNVIRLHRHWMKSWHLKRNKFD
jgi:hypothetical protein